MNRQVFLYVAIFGVIVAIIIATRYNKTKENWWGNPSRSIKVMPEVMMPDGSITSLSDQGSVRSSALDPQMPFVSVPSFQSLLAPRINPNGYRPFITYNMTDYKNQAVPKNPLGYNNKESFKNIKCDSCISPNVNSQGSIQPLSQSANLTDDCAEVSDGTNDMLPITTLGSTDGGVQDQPIVFDRYIFAQKKSRRTQDADFIRGDLPIQPMETGWFRPSVNVLTDLRQGAMSVMGGYDNDTSKDLAQLINKTSGGTMSVIGGVDLTTQLGNISQDVTVTSFP